MTSAGSDGLHRSAPMRGVVATWVGLAIGGTLDCRPAVTREAGGVSVDSPRAAATVAHPATQLASPPDSSNDASKMPDVVDPIPQPRDASCGTNHPEWLRSVGEKLEAEVRRIETNAYARIEVTFDCPPDSPPLHARALRMEGHSGGIVLLAIDPEETGFAARVLRVGSRPSAALDNPPPPVRASRTHVGPQGADALERALLTLSAHVHVSLSPPDDAGLHLRSILTTAHDEWLSVYLSNDRGFASRRDWAGYESNLEEPARAPVSLSLSMLIALAANPPVSTTPDDADRSLLAELWPATGTVPAWAMREVLSTASALGSPKLVPWIASLLDASDTQTQILVVNALAAITGYDVRRNSAGAVRPLVEVVANYREWLASR